MREEVVIITPELTPGAGGVADYTQRLVRELGERIEPRFILPNDTRDDLRAKLPSSGGKVLLQYSAYGFDRVGYPRQLLRALTDWKKTADGLLVIMFHEIWGFWPLLNRNRFVQRLHRADIGRLIARADVIFTSTPSQADYLRKLQPREDIQFLPVGSNIQRMSQLAEPRDKGLAVLFGLQGARVNALRKMRADLAALASAGTITKIVSVGAGNCDARDVDERSLLSAIGLTSGFEMRGTASEEEVSKLLGHASFALSIQNELSVTKSGTFMACAAHELNIISSAADQSAAEPICWLTNADELLRGIQAQELKLRAQNLRVWQERTSSWPIIAERFAEALRLKKAVRA